MDKIQEQWPEWQTVELVGEGTFGSVYKAKKEVYGNISYAAIKVIEIPKEPREIRDLQQSDMDESSIKAFYEDMIHNLMSEIQIMESMKSAYGIVGIEDYKVVERTFEMGSFYSDGISGRSADLSGQASDDRL